MRRWLKSQENMEDWENMRSFAIKVIEHALKYKNGDILEQRIAVTNLDHATELSMKAFLIKESYLINEIDRGKLKERNAKNKKIEEILDNDKTIGFKDALDLVLKILNLNANDKTEIRTHIEKFHSIRNEIQHRALNLPFDKSEEMKKFYPILRKLYIKIFPDQTDFFPLWESNLT